MLLTSVNTLPKFDGIIDTITLWVNASLAILIVLQVIFASIKAIIIWWSIIRNSDEPETRATYIAALKWPIIAIVGTCVVIGLSNIIIQIIKQAGLTIHT